MSEVSAVLGLPYIQPAQAQKHVTHNEALRVLDVIAQLAVADRTRTAAPASPEIGARHIVGDGAVGEWSGQDGTIAVWDIEGWIFFAPQAGWRAEVLSEGQSVVWSGTEWVATGAQPQAVQQLGINTSADAANRLAVSSAATLFTHAGAGHQLKVNKAVAGDTASLLFQTNFSGRAEMGLAGSDEFSVKVSADGIGFAEGLRIAPDGAATLPNGVLVPDGTASRPGVRFAGDTDTGIARPGADQIALITGGSQRALLSSGSLQINVPMSGTAVQTTSHDTTPGRLARVSLQGGIFGLGVVQGGTLGDVPVSANTVAAAGLYRTDTTTTNLPVTAASGLLEVFHGAGGDSVHQRWSATTADQATRTWQRRSVGGTWLAWSLVFNQSTVLGPVTQSAGIPTGAILERGSNTNGEFVRFADGTQICTRTNLSAPNASTATGTLFRSADVGWTFPIAFAAAPAVTGGTDVSDIWCTTAAPSSSAVNMRAMSSISRSTAVPMRALAIGRWF